VFPGKDEVEDGAEGVDISMRSLLPIRGGLFWSHKSEGASDLSIEGVVGGVEDGLSGGFVDGIEGGEITPESPIADEDFIEEVALDVIWLEIIMDDVRGVRICDGVTDFDKVLEEQVSRVSIMHHFGEGIIPLEVHGEEWGPVMIETGFIDLDDVGVLEGGGEPGLVDEVFMELLTERLSRLSDGNMAVGARVIASVDDFDGAFAQEGEFRIERGSVTAKLLEAFEAREEARVMSALGKEVV